jgi:membrane protease YdiL (CAAX protease family)
VAALLFGLSHFNHGARFNWRYVLLAAIAGIFYGRAWRARRQIFASVVTHTAIDVVWSLWFR